MLRTEKSRFGNWSQSIAGFGTDDDVLGSHSAGRARSLGTWLQFREAVRFGEVTSALEVKC